MEYNSEPLEEQAFEEEGQIPEESIQPPSFFDCLFRLGADEAIRELVKKGIRTAKDIKQSAKNTFHAIAEEEYAKICIPILTMNNCLTWVKVQKASYPQGQYFFIYVEENPVPRNENDNYSVAIALLDAYKKPIPVSAKRKSFLVSNAANQSINQDIVCLVIPAGTIDNKLIKALNGTQSVLVKL